MSKIINLRQVRKSRARDTARRQGDENAARFGRTKAEIAAEKAESARESRRLDAHRLDED